MDTAIVLSATNAASAARPGDPISISVARKAMDMQAAHATQLIQAVGKSVPRPEGALGQHIDTHA